MGLDKKNILITGANGDIGRSIIEAFAIEKSNIIAQMRCEKQDFLEYASLITAKYNVNIMPIYFDLTNEKQVKSEIQHLIKSKIPVDVLINNAGVAHGGLMQMTSLADIRRIYDINFFAVVQMMQLVSRIMAHQGGGSIINISSVSGLELAAGNIAYGTSKAAVIALTKTASKELAAQNIRVNAVAPGLTDTHMAELMEQKAGEAMVRQAAFNRLAKSSEIADAVVYLSSEKASFITGQVLRVDGGM